MRITRHVKVSIIFLNDLLFGLIKHVSAVEIFIIRDDAHDTMFHDSLTEEFVSKFEDRNNWVSLWHFNLHENEIEINRVQNLNHIHLEEISEEITLLDGVKENYYLFLKKDSLRKISKDDFRVQGKYKSPFDKILVSLVCSSVYSIRSYLYYPLTQAFSVIVDWCLFWFWTRFLQIFVCNFNLHFYN